MAAQSQLCPVCIQIVQPKNRSAVNAGYVTPEGQSLETFQRAAEQHCFICFSLWNLSERHRIEWANLQPSLWRPLSFSVTKEESDSFMRLSVMYKDPTRNRGELITDVRFRLIRPEDNNYNTLFAFPDIDKCTSSSTVLDTAFSWYESCLSSHDSCKRLPISSPGWLPSRMLDIGVEGHSEWRLRITSEDILQPPTPPYMTLSYRWGLVTDILLLSSTLDEFRRGKPIAELPQTFKDLVKIAWRFGIRYIWLDCLCIIQDSHNDWVAEAVTMRYVYANSACNIAACGALDPQGGLFCTRDPRDIRPGLIETTLASDFPETYYIFDKSYWDRQMFGGTLHHRGWVFQERFLAPRQLHFSKQQILWECLDEHKCEGFPYGIPLHDSFKSIVPLMELSRHKKRPEDGQMSYLAIDLWIDLVAKYSSCEFTRPSDKLLAFAGVAKLFQEVTNDTYVAGMWKSRILDLLDWYVYEPTAKLSPDYRAPSWSWASIDGPVKPRRPAHGCKFLVELVDVGVSTEGKDATVGVTDGFIKLKGTVIVASCQQTTTGQLEIVTDKLSHPIYIQAYPDTTDINVFKGGQICFLLYKTEQVNWRNGTTYGSSIDLICLILEAVEGSSSTYCRVGHFVTKREETLRRFLSAIAKEWEDITLV